MASIIFKLIVCMIGGGLLFFPVWLIYRHFEKGEARQARYKEQAIAKGHVVVAKLTKLHAAAMQDPGHPHDRDRIGIYHYEYHGKRFRYRLSAVDPPARLTLYFLSSPRLADEEGLIKGSRWGLRLIYLVMVVVFYCLIFAGK